MPTSPERTDRLISCLKLSRNLMNSPDHGHYLIGLTCLKSCQGAAAEMAILAYFMTPQVFTVSVGMQMDGWHEEE